MNYKIPHVIIQGTQAGGNSREVCFLTDDVQISFFMTDNQLDGFINTIQKEIDFNRKIEEEFSDCSSSTVKEDRNNE